jgi:hypothetical protein
MNGLEFLDLVIGLIFIYLIYSIACSTIWEIVISFSQLRGKMLFRWIYNSFGNREGDLGKLIANHPMIKGLTRKTNRLPSYISSGLFTDVLLDIINSKSGEKSGLSFDISLIKKSIEKSTLLNKDLQRVFLQYFSEADGRLNIAKEKIAGWFDEAQQRLMGSYRKRLQMWIFAISVVLVGFTNADTIKLASYLYNNDTARESIALKATLFVQDTSIVRFVSKIDTSYITFASKQEKEKIVKNIKKDFETIKRLDNELKEAEIPLGWGKEEISGFSNWAKKIVGLLLSTLAVSMGSPFWFDVLSKLANLRSTGNKPKSMLDIEPDNKK